jgi:hypothetical protein
MFILEALAGRPQYAFVRLVAAVPDDASRSAVLDELLAFAGELAWPLRTVVSGDAPATALAEATAPAAVRDREYARED